MSAVFPGRDEIILTAPASRVLCNNLACARAGRAAEVIATFGTLNDAGAGYYDRAGLCRQQWSRSYPLCGACWEQTRQVATRYRLALVIIDTTPDRPAPAAPQPSGGRA